MKCPNCQTSYHDTVKRCKRCGAGFQWEQKEWTIPIHDVNAHTPSHEARFNEQVQRHLEEAKHEGWQAAGPVDWESLQATDRI